MGKLGANMSAGVNARARGGCVVHRCQNKNPIERLTSGREWRHAPEVRAWRILGILKKSVSWVENWTLDENGWLSLARGGFRQVSHESWGQMKKPEQKECVSLSLCRRTFKLKGYKKFRIWTEKSKVFFVFRDSYVLWIYILCTFHTYPYHGYGTPENLSRKMFWNL